MNSVRLSISIIILQLAATTALAQKSNKTVPDELLNSTPLTLASRVTHLVGGAAETATGLALSGVSLIGNDKLKIKNLALLIDDSPYLRTVAEEKALRISLRNIVRQHKKLVATYAKLKPGLTDSYLENKLITKIERMAEEITRGQEDLNEVLVNKAISGSEFVKKFSSVTKLTVRLVGFAGGIIMMADGVGHIYCATLGTNNPGVFVLDDAASATIHTLFSK